MRFVHTADWQLGRPFGRIGDPHKRSLVQHERIEAIKRIGQAAREVAAGFVLVAGDLFDSRSADKATVSAACSAIGEMGLPVIAIPGNHDHGGPGSVWDQEFFGREQATLAPNLAVLLAARPYVLDDDMGGAVILPCPLMQRFVVSDPTQWLQAPDLYADLPAGKPRIVLAHGSTQAFVGQWGDEDEDASTGGVINVDRLAVGEVDYVALGDWHGTKQVGPHAWYAGTPELDRFPRGTDQNPGNVLVVDVERSGHLRVTEIRTGRLRWHQASFDLSDYRSLVDVETELASLVGQRANEDLLHLTLSGTIGIEDCSRLDRLIESLEARLLRLRLVDQTTLAPSMEEIEALTQRGSDPLVAQVARRLVDLAVGGGAARDVGAGGPAAGGASRHGAGDRAADNAAAVARIALRELHAALRQEGAA